MTKRLVDISCVLMFDHLKSYMCKASELRRLNLNFLLNNLHLSCVPDVF